MRFIKMICFMLRLTTVIFQNAFRAKFIFYDFFICIHLNLFDLDFLTHYLLLDYVLYQKWHCIKSTTIKLFFLYIYPSCKSKTLKPTAISIFQPEKSHFFLIMLLVLCPEEA